MVTHKLRILGMKWENVRNIEQLPNPRLGIKKFEFDHRIVHSKSTKLKRSVTHSVV